MLAVAVAGGGCLDLDKYQPYPEAGAEGSAPEASVVAEGGDAAREAAGEAAAEAAVDASGDAAAEASADASGN